jgi:AGZA family xanthine/uracil permease-like MFS transporter
VPVLGDLAEALGGGHLAAYLSVIIPMGLFNLLGSLQNIESAEAAGDPYPVAPSLAMNGVGTIAAACFGSCFPTTIYIGHPGWKGMGARAGYSVLNAVFFTAVCLTGLLGAIQYAIPLDAGLAIVLYIGIVITAQAFQATPREHAPAVVLGLIPAVAAWGVLMVKAAFRVGSGGRDLTPAVAEQFRVGGVWVDGAFALNEGFILTAMIWAAVAAAVIDRQFRTAGLWCAAAAALSVVGLMHSFRYDGSDTVMALGVPAWHWVAGYAAMGALFVAAPWVTEPAEEPRG